MAYLCGAECNPAERIPVRHNCDARSQIALNSSPVESVAVSHARSIADSRALPSVRREQEMDRAVVQLRRRLEVRVDHLADLGGAVWGQLVQDHVS